MADLFIVGVAPIDYSPILLLRLFGFRIAPDTLPSRIFRAAGSRSALAVSGFHLRARLGFSIPVCSPGQRGVTPAFGYGPPHSSAEGTSTPMTHALPSAHEGFCRPGNRVGLPGLHGGGRSPQEPVCGGRSFRIMPTLLQLMFFWGVQTASFCAFRTDQTPVFTMR